MSESKIIQRTVTIRLTLLEAAEALGMSKRWTSVNEYLDADPWEDVYHNGYGVSDLKDFYLTKINENMIKLFPDIVCSCLEDAERDAWANEIGKRRRDCLKESFELITNLDCDYMGIDEAGKEVHVAVKAGITGVLVNTSENEVLITVQNPEHLINEIINGLGYFYPRELVVDQAADEAKLKRFFVANISGYFDVYGVSKASDEVPRYFSPSIDEDYMLENFQDRIHSQTIDEISSRVVEAFESKKFETIQEAIKAYSDLTELSEEAIRAATSEKFKTERSKLDRIISDLK